MTSTRPTLTIDKKALLPCPFCGDKLIVREHSAFHPTATVGKEWCWLTTAGELGGPYELPSTEYAAWNTRALPPSPENERRAFWLLERFADGHSQGYWDGGNSRSFQSNVENAVQFCRHSDALCIALSWHWKDVKITEHIMLPPSPAAEGVIAENTRLKDAIAWALGENGEFPERPEGGPAYWWRTELRRRATGHELYWDERQIKSRPATPADKPPHCAEHRIVNGQTVHCPNTPTVFEYGVWWCEEHRTTRRGKR